MRSLSVIAHLRWNFQFGQDVIGGLLASETRPALDVTVVSADRPLRRTTLKAIKPFAVVGDSHYAESIDYCRERGIHFIDLTGSRPREDLHQIQPDDLRIGTMAADYLRECGLVHFAYVGFSDQAYSMRREMAFRDALGSADLPVWRSPLSPYLLGSEEPGLLEFLKGLPRPCGIFACSDLRAMALVSTLKRRLTPNPSDLFLLGVDVDLVLRRITGCQIPSIDQAAWFHGWQAGQLIQKLARNPDLPVQMEKMPPIRVVEAAAHEPGARKDPFTKKLMEALEANFHHPDGLTRAMEVLPRSRRSIENHARKHLGASPLQLLHRIRLKAVLSLLEDPEVSILDVAHRTGFAYQGDLTRFVRKTVGVPPSVLRKGLLTNSGTDPRNFA